MCSASVPSLIEELKAHANLILEFLHDHKPLTEKVTELKEYRHRIPRFVDTLEQFGEISHPLDLGQHLNFTGRIRYLADRTLWVSLDVSERTTTPDDGLPTPCKWPVRLTYSVQLNRDDSKESLLLAENSLDFNRICGSQTDEGRQELFSLTEAGRQGQISQPQDGRQGKICQSQDGRQGEISQPQDGRQGQITQQDGRQGQISQQRVGVCIDKIKNSGLMSHDVPATVTWTLHIESCLQSRAVDEYENILTKSQKLLDDYLCSHDEWILIRQGIDSLRQAIQGVLSPVSEPGDIKRLEENLADMNEKLRDFEEKDENFQHLLIQLKSCSEFIDKTIGI